MTDRSIGAVIARLRFGDSDGDDHDIAADYIDALRELLREALFALNGNEETCLAHNDLRGRIDAALERP